MIFLVSCGLGNKVEISSVNQAIREPASWCFRLSGFLENKGVELNVQADHAHIVWMISFLIPILAPSDARIRGDVVVFQLKQV